MTTLRIYNKGIGGQNSAEGRTRFLEDAVALHPDFVFIYFGLNDTLNELKFTSCEEFTGNLAWMVDEARKANIKPVLCTIHRASEEPLFQRHDPKWYGDEGPNGKINRYNEALRQLAREKSVPLADFAGAAARAGHDMVVCPDGVHLTAAGSRLLAETFADATGRELHPGSSVVCFGDSVTQGSGLEGDGTITGDTYPAHLVQLLSNLK